MCSLRGMAALLSLGLVAMPSTSAEAGGAPGFALVVGAMGYPELPDVDRLKYPGNDANAFAEFLRSSAGGAVPAENIKLLVAEGATRDAVRRALQELSAKVPAKARFYFYYSGHAVVAPSGLLYFLPYDASPSELLINGIRAEEFMQDIDLAIRAEQKIFILDACHSAALARAAGTRGEEDVNSALQEILSRSLEFP